MKGVLLRTVQGTVAVIVQIHIDETVSLGHLRGGHAHQVNRSPACVANQFYTVKDRFLHLGDMLAEVVNAVAVMDGTVSFYFVIRPEAIFHNKQRFLVTVVHGVQHNS
ncbi:hypothetical protein D3C75_1239650 [compost metagenome]